MLLDHEIVCQARARVPDPAVGPVQAIPTSVQSWDQANGVVLHWDSLPAFTNLTEILLV